MTIERIERWVADFGFYNAIYIRITDSDGAYGDAEIAMRRRTRTLVALVDELGESLIGADPARISLLNERMIRDAFLAGGLFNIVVSGFDTALWDLKSKSAGLPLYQMLGGAYRTRVPLYTHVAAGESPEAFAESVAERVSAGFSAIKTTLPGFYKEVTSIPHRSAPVVPLHQNEYEPIPNQYWNTVESFIAAGRAAAGSDVRILLDCHGRLSPANAIRLCEVLAPYDLGFVEEPVMYEQPAWTRQVAARSRIPIAVGERAGAHHSSALMIAESGAAYFQPDVMVCGGITVAAKICAVAESQGTSIAFHNPYGPLQSLATWHLAATIPNHYLSESMLTPSQRPYWSRYVDVSPSVEDGHWSPTDRPGLGSEIDLDAVSHASANLAYDRLGTR